jgi:hypothetical protein
MLDHLPLARWTLPSGEILDIYVNDVNFPPGKNSGALSPASTVVWIKPGPEHNTPWWLCRQWSSESQAMRFLQQRRPRTAATARAMMLPIVVNELRDPGDETNPVG